MSLRDWTKQSGTFKIGEFTKSQGDLITNGDCEVDIPNISGTSMVAQRGTVAISADYSFSGSKSAKYVGDGVLDSTHYVSINSKLIGGKKYHFGIWVYIPIDNTNITELSLRIWNGIYWNILQTTTIQGSWVYLSGTATVESTNWVAIYSGYSLATNETFYIDDFCITEVDPLPTITTGTKYLECVTVGKIAIPNTQAYGTWEWDWNKSAYTNYIIPVSDRADATFNTTNGYTLATVVTGVPNLIKSSVGTYSNLNFTAASYAPNLIWYSYKLTRSCVGQFHLYIKGGSFGNTWTLVSTTGGSGTNPVTDNTYTTSNYFVAVLNPGDKIANIKFYDGVRQ